MSCKKHLKIISGSKQFFTLRQKPSCKKQDPSMIKRCFLHSTQHHICSLSSFVSNKFTNVCSVARCDKKFKPLNKGCTWIEPWLSTFVSNKYTNVCRKGGGDRTAVFIAMLLVSVFNQRYLKFFGSENIFSQTPNRLRKLWRRNGFWARVTYKRTL